MSSQHVLVPPQKVEMTSFCDSTAVASAEADRVAGAPVDEHLHEHLEQAENSKIVHD